MIDITNNLDLCKDIEQRGGMRIKLDPWRLPPSVLQKRPWAPRLSNGGRNTCRRAIQALMDIARYCCFDVKVTRDVHWYGAEHGFIRYDDKKGGQVELPVDWKL